MKTCALVSALAFATALTACKVEKTEEGEMPEVSVEGGKMPKYDVQTPDVKVQQEKKTITVPDVDIVTPEEKARASGTATPAAGAATTPADAGTPVPTATPTP